MRDIKRIEEKAGKIFYIMEENHKTSFPSFVKYWHSKWREDFILENGSVGISKHGRILDKTLREQYMSIFEEYSFLWRENTSKQMLRVIRKTQTKEIMPTSVYHMANRLGFRVFKARKNNIDPTNNILSGFQIEKDGKVIAGKHYDLSLEDIKNILQEEEKEVRICQTKKQQGRKCNQNNQYIVRSRK